MTQEWQTQSILTRMLIGQQAKKGARLVHRRFKLRGLEAPFIKFAPGLFAKRLQQIVQHWLPQPSISCDALVLRNERAKTRIEFKVSKMANRNNDACRLRLK